MLHLKNKNSSIKFEGDREDLVELLVESVSDTRGLEEFLIEVYLKLKRQKVEENKEERAYLSLELNRDSCKRTIIGYSQKITILLAELAVEGDDFRKIMKVALEAAETIRLSKLN